MAEVLHNVRVSTFLHLLLTLIHRSFALLRMTLQTTKALLLVLTAFAFAAGCSSEPEVTRGPPEGWTADGDRWWRAGADTSGAFRDLGSLQSMGVKGADITYAVSMALAERKSTAVRQLSRAVKVSLLPIFRNEPEIVDSLFERHVVPRIEKADLDRAPDHLVDRFKAEGYRILARHFREPRTVLSLGTDVPIVYPDSLREAGVTGRVRMQVRLNAEGEPVALQLIDGVHPVLDDIAMEATTRMRWQPAYLLETGKSRPVPSWVRFTVNFQTG